MFKGNFTQQEPIPDEAISAAVRVMRSGRLHRYNSAPGELGEVDMLEVEFAEQMGAKYCLAVASGGYALGCAMRALGVGAGDQVLTNAFTLAPVPGAIAALGATPVLVETTDALIIDLVDLKRKMRLSGARVLLLSHMRGHICDMDAVVGLCEEFGVRLIEDCAHTMGAHWNDTPSGRHGVFGCYSTQTYKHLNSGEGGIMISNDPDAMARAILLSGSYMNYATHRAAPPGAAFERARFATPNVSGRMDNLRAAILRVQLARLPEQVEAWNLRYRTVESGLRKSNQITVIERSAAERFVGSSIQFRLPGRDSADIQDFLNRCGERGVELKWFGAPEPRGFTSRYDSWQYFKTPELPRTDAVLAQLIDMRLPLTFSQDDCRLVARIICDEAARA